MSAIQKCILFTETMAATTDYEVIASEAAAELDRMTAVIEAARILETIARDFLDDCSHLDNPRMTPEETYRLAYGWFKNYGKHFSAALDRLQKAEEK